MGLRFDGPNFIGIGKVQCGDTPLRNGQRPMFVEIRNPEGIQLRDFRIVKQQVTPQRVVLEFSMTREQGGPMEWMVHTVRNRYNAIDWTQRPLPALGTRLKLEMRPVERTLGGRRFAGFSYQYSYSSRDIPIYKILDRSTWEPGGRAVGNEFWMRNCFVPAIVPFRSKRQFHSTEWYLPSCTNPNVVQFLPLQTELQGFTFTSCREGSLVTWVTKVAHVRSLFEKPRGVDEIRHWHEHCGDLAHQFTTSPMEVLWSAGALDRVGRANLYEVVKEQVHEALHADIGLRRERIGTYGQIEEWGPADLKLYRTRGLPKLLAAGVERVYLANHFQNNMNTWGVSNFCCTVDYQVAETVGEENLKAFCHAARAGGAKVQMWGNTALSTLNFILDKRDAPTKRIKFLPREGSVREMLAKAESPYVRNPSNAIEADHYTPVFAVLNLRDPSVRAYWLRRWRQAHQKVGLDGIFLDSSFNMSSDKFHFVANTKAGQVSATPDQVHLLGHYRPAVEPPAAILSQYRAHLELMVAMQRGGYEYFNEDLGVFGLHRHGPAIVARLDNLFLWSDCLVDFDVAAIRKAGADSDAIFFRGLAYRLMWTINWIRNDDALSFRYGQIQDEADRPTEWHLSIFKAFSKLSDRMIRREILDGEKGVVYHDGRRQVLWAFNAFDFPLDEVRRVREWPAGTITRTAVVCAQAHRVYEIL